jgi:uncharacterized protein
MLDGFRSIALAVVTTVAANAAPPMPVVVVHAPNADLRLEVAITPAQQEHGLMGRTSMAPHAGMLFVFDRDEPVEFWMKNTLIPLDMVFVGRDGTVRKVFRNVPTVPAALPDDNIPREAATAKFVIELGANEAQRDGIGAGVRLVIPATAP